MPSTNVTRSSSRVYQAKWVIQRNTAVLYGIFGFIDSTPYFPPREHLNEFFERGSDPCDQDGRMGGWAPFALSQDEYEEVKFWWISNHPSSLEDALGTSNWTEWCAVLIEGEDE